MNSDDKKSYNLDLNQDEDSSISLFKVKSVSKFFRKQKALDDVSFTISKGSFHALVGENGSGKSTIIKMLIGSSSKKNHSGFIETDKNIKMSFFPEIAIFPGNWNTYKYLYNTGMVRVENKEKVDFIVRETMKDLNILDLEKKNPNSFSSGQKKKVLLARIIIEDPDVVILDEPAANLDIAYRKFLFEQLKKLNNKGKTIVLTSHLLTEISPYINEATILNSGRLYFNGKIEKGTLEMQYAKVISEIWNKS